jgi:hypothetical protein
MTVEMNRWQQQAQFTQQAVMEAKNEVLERKRELDSTKVRKILNVIDSFCSCGVCVGARVQVRVRVGMGVRLWVTYWPVKPTPPSHSAQPTMVCRLASAARLAEACCVCVQPQEKMDRLLDKLYVGRERGMELQASRAPKTGLGLRCEPRPARHCAAAAFLGSAPDAPPEPPSAAVPRHPHPPPPQQGAIAAAQSFAHHANSQHGQYGQPGPHVHAGYPGPSGLPPPHGLASMGGLMPPAMLMAQAGRPQALLLPPHPPPPGGADGQRHGHSNIPRLPPVNPRPPALAREASAGAPAPRRLSAPGPGSLAPPSPPPYGYDPAGYGAYGPLASNSVSGGYGPGGVGPQPSFASGGGASPSPQRGGRDGDDPYAGVASRFAQPSEAQLARQQAAAARKAGAKGGGGGGKPLDRFEEGRRDEARIAAMAKRWG